MIAALVASGAWAGAWTRASGAGYAKVGVDVYRAARFVAPGESDPSPGSYVGEQVGGWVEAGVGPKAWPIQLAVGAPVTVGHHRTSVTSVVGPIEVRATTARLGDLHLVPQLALHPELPLALAVDLKVPLYRNDGVGGDSGQAALFPKPGDGQLDVTPTLWAGAARGTAFGELGLGWRHRTEQFVGWTTPVSFVDAGVVTAKGGVDLGRVLPIAQVDAVLSLAPDPYSRQSVTASLSALIDVVADHVALEPRVAGELWARNASQGYGAGLGLSVRR
jgi:hypothetical protein